MTSFAEKVDFFGVADDKIIYDERKKRFVHTKDLPGYMARELMNGGFKSVSKFILTFQARPDLVGNEKLEFEWKLRFGQQLIRYMNY